MKPRGTRFKQKTPYLRQLQDSELSRIISEAPKIRWVTEDTPDNIKQGKVSWVQEFLSPPNSLYGYAVVRGTKFPVCRFNSSEENKAQAHVCVVLARYYFEPYRDRAVSREKDEHLGFAYAMLRKPEVREYFDRIAERLVALAVIFRLPFSLDHYWEQREAGLSAREILKGLRRTDRVPAKHRADKGVPERMFADWFAKATVLHERVAAGVEELSQVEEKIKKVVSDGLYQIRREFEALRAEIIVLSGKVAQARIVAVPAPPTVLDSTESFYPEIAPNPQNALVPEAPKQPVVLKPVGSPKVTDSDVSVKEAAQVVTKTGAVSSEGAVSFPAQDDPPNEGLW